MDDENTIYKTPYLMGYLELVSKNLSFANITILLHGRIEKIDKYSTTGSMYY